MDHTSSQDIQASVLFREQQANDQGTQDFGRSNHVDPTMSLPKDILLHERMKPFMDQKNMVVVTMFDKQYIKWSAPFYHHLVDLGIDNVCMIVLDDESEEYAKYNKLPYLTLTCLLNDCAPFQLNEEVPKPTQMGRSLIRFQVPSNIHVKISLVRAVIDADVHLLFAEVRVFF